jgi:crossover junction endodeoxyribonuclease RuvC
VRRVLGIDPGSRTLGFGAVELRDGVLRHVAHGVVEARDGGALGRRLVEIRGGLAQVVTQHEPDAVALEGLFYARNVQSALKLAHARGVAMELVSSLGVPVIEYSPMEVKRGVVGYGRASKEQVARMVQRLLALPTQPIADAADALALAICHLHAVRLASLVARRRASPS